MKKNIFVLSENEKERILGMHRMATKKNYLFEQNPPAAPGGTPATPGGTPATPLPAQPTDVLGFQQWVINQKGDKAILGKSGPSGFGDDGKYGAKTTAAWQKYGQEYHTQFGGASPQQAIQNTAKDQTAWLGWDCLTKVGTKLTTKSGYILYQLAPGFIASFDSTAKKPALFSGAGPGKEPKFERHISICEDQALNPQLILQANTAEDKKNWANWACITSVGTERVQSKGWVVYDFPNNQYAYFDDIVGKPALANSQTKERLRYMDCNDEAMKAVSAATATAAAAEQAKKFPGLASLPQDIQTRITAWAETPDGKYVMSLPAAQREQGMDSLEKRRGGANPETRALKKQIRTALGMAADNVFGRIGQGVQGAIQGAQTGFAGGPAAQPVAQAAK